ERLQDPMLAGRIRAAARAEAEHHSWEAASEDLLSAYRTAIARHHRHQTSAGPARRRGIVRSGLTQR
ncbi:MAG: hypothetical protein Q4G40_00710, partial [Brachybacterium sp.]|nr:hypothetical protein [Brachybacterium sp.]